MKKCDTCEGTGEIEIIINYFEFHFEGDEPITEIEFCEDCGGTGYIKDNKE